MYVLWLGHPQCHDRELVGGKVAHLSRLASAYPVPPGFCVTTRAYDLGVAGGISSEVQVSWDRGLPSELLELVADAYRKLALMQKDCSEAEPRVAVRSSALDEDGVNASFAGQHETFLNVGGLEAISKAIAGCWASARSERAVEYRRRLGLVPEGGKVAVLVQQLVVADASAVAFGANPVTGNRDEIVINASWGLGESIVGGTVTPDSYVVRKADLSIIARQVGLKERMTVAVPGGTREVDVPRFVREQPALDAGQVVETARLVLALEASMGWPADVECAFKAGQLYLLQCRPITSLPRRTGTK